MSFVDSSSYAYKVLNYDQEGHIQVSQLEYDHISDSAWAYLCSTFGLGVSVITKVSNPQLTPSSGEVVWTINASTYRDQKFSDYEPDFTNAVCIVKDSVGNEVFTSIQYTSTSIIIKMNASATVAASSYVAVISHTLNQYS